MRTARYSEAYKIKSKELKKHVMDKYEELGAIEDVDLLKLLAEFIQELDKNSNLRKTKLTIEKLHKESSNEMRKELLDFLIMTIKLVSVARSCCLSAETSVTEKSQLIKDKIKAFYLKNKKDLKQKTGQKEFVKLFYKLISLILLKYGILIDTTS